MATNDSVAMVTLGETTVQVTTWWPQQWQWSAYTYVLGQQHEQDYANEVVIERGEFDAVLTFYRRRGDVQVYVKQVTVPLALLDVMGRTDGE